MWRLCKQFVFLQHAATVTSLTAVQKQILTKLSHTCIYSRCRCRGIATYFMRISRVLNPVISYWYPILVSMPHTDTSHWYWYWYPITCVGSAAATAASTTASPLPGTCQRRQEPGPKPGSWRRRGSSSRCDLPVSSTGSRKRIQTHCFWTAIHLVFISSSGSVGVVKAATSLRPRRLAR